MYRNPYLIQRLNRKPTNGSIADHRFGEIWELDYMGAAEYEFGAFPKMLVSLAENLKELRTFHLDVDVTGSHWRDKDKRTGKTRVFGFYDSTMATDREVMDAITKIAADKIRLKMPANMSDGRVTGWVDIVNHFFWSTENMSMSIVHSIKRSSDYILEQRKKSEK